jgi:hypothetical protein
MWQKWTCGAKLDGRTQFKRAKKLSTKILKLKSNGPVSNSAPTQEFIIHLSFEKIHVYFSNIKTNLLLVKKEKKKLKQIDGRLCGYPK